VVRFGADNSDEGVSNMDLSIKHFSELEGVLRSIS
jgi:hypothetical protein